MERLTYWNEEYGCWSYHCGSGEAANRLAAYEDTELTPKEVKRMSNILLDVGIEYNCSREYVKNWLLDAANLPKPTRKAGSSSCRWSLGGRCSAMRILNERG